MSMAGGGLALALVPLWGSVARAVRDGRDRRSGRRSSLVAASRRASRRARRSRAGCRPSSTGGCCRSRAMHAASFGLSVVIGNWVVTLLHRAGGDPEHVAGLAGGLVLFLGSCRGRSADG